MSRKSALFAVFDNFKISQSGTNNISGNLKTILLQNH
jgi:hypothetical protein